MENFSGLNLQPAIAQALLDLGFEKPTPIQAAALPILLGPDTDFLGLAATGTGKTAAFGIPLIQRFDPAASSLQALVLCPTRELAMQTARQLTLLGKHTGREVPAIYGGGHFIAQRTALQTAPIVVATPGRLIDHMEQGNVNLESLKTLVLDEADEMISMGFEEALDHILAATPRETCRKWLFSATLPKHLREVAEKYMVNPQRVQLNSKQVLSGTVRQVYYTVRDKNKLRGLTKLIDMQDDFYGLIFTQTRAQAAELAQYLRGRHYRADALHGDQQQSLRERTLAAFRERRTQILVCTDVAARGLDVSGLTHVINFSLPLDAESYVHRIGRTGRGGKEGVAVSLVAPQQMFLIRIIEKRTGVKLEPGIFPSRKEVSARKLARFLPDFDNVPNFERAQELLDETWKTRLEGLSKEEIAARFLALSLPELFDGVEIEEEAMTARAPRDRRENRTFQNDRRSQKKPYEKKPRFEKKRYQEEPRPEQEFVAQPEISITPAAADEVPPPAEMLMDAPPTAPEMFTAGDAPETAEMFEAQEAGVTPTPPRHDEAVIADLEGEERAFVQKKEFSKKPYGEKKFGGRKPFEGGFKKPFGGPRREFGEGGEGGEGRPFRKPFGGGFKKPFGRKPFGEGGGGGGFRKPFGGPRREFGGEEGGEGRPFRKPFGGPRRDFGGGEGGGFRKPFGGPRRDFGGGEGGGFRKPFGGPRRDFGGGEGGGFRKPFGGPRRDFGGGEGGGFRKPFGQKGFGGPRRPFGEGEGGGGGFRKPFGRKPFGAKPFGGPRRPFGEGEGEGMPAPFKKDPKFTGTKRYVRPGAKPGHPKGE